MNPFCPIILLGLLIFCFPCYAKASGAPRTATRPSHSRGGPSVGSTADVLRRVLPNGLTVLVEPRHTAPVVTVMMWYRVGSRDEVPGQTGLAHFIEHLMFKGTPTLAKGEIDRLTMQAGGSNNAFTTADYTAYVFNLPADHWKLALRIEADRMRHSRFVAGEFEAERQVVMEERRSGEDDPGERLSEQVDGITFLAHPYRNPVIGWMSDLRRLTREQILAFYQRYYVPGNATCVIVGDVDPSTAVREAERAFAAVPRLPVPPRPRPIEPLQIGERRVTVRLQAQAPRIEIQFHTPRRGHPHQAPLDLVVRALAAGKSSRLYQRLVEGERLATEVSGDVGDALDPDATHFAAVLKPGASLERAEAAMLDELRKVTGTPLSADELTKARNQRETGWVLGQDTTDERARLLGEAASLTGLGYLDQYLPRLAAVSPDQAQRVAALYFRDTNRTVGWLVPTRAEAPAKQIRTSRANPECGSLLSFSPEELSHEGFRPVVKQATPIPRAEISTLAPASPISLVLKPAEGYEPRSRQSGKQASPLLAGVRARPAWWKLALRPLNHDMRAVPAPRQAPPPLVKRRCPDHRSHLPTEQRLSLPHSLTPSPPHSLTPSPFRPLPVLRHVLPNGLTVLLLENHVLPLFTATAMVHAGSRDETESQAGLAHFTADALDNGTTSRSDLQIAQTLESLGIGLEAASSGSVTTLRVDGLSRAMRPAVEVWADVLRHPVFPADKVTAERDRILADIRSTADEPVQVAGNAFRELVYGPHPWHRPVEGYERTVGQLTRDDLARFHQEFYIPGRTTIALVGDFRTQDALSLIERLFGDWEQRAPPALAIPAPVPQTVRREKHLTLPKEQTQIVLGHLGVTRRNPDYVPLEVLDMILGTGAGGTFTARIPQQLRDVQGLAYTVGASITSTAGDDPGMFIASMGVQPRNSSRAVAGLLREIRRIRAEPVSPKELQDAKQYLTGSYVFDFETNDQLAAYLLEVEHYGLGLDYRMRYPAFVRAVTAPQLLRLARRYLDPVHYTLVVVGPPVTAAPTSTAARKR